MLSALMNQASDLLQQTKDRLNANALGLPASADSSGGVKNPAGAVPALEKSDADGGAFNRFDRDATTLRLSPRARLQAFGEEQNAAGANQNNALNGLGNLGQAVAGAIQELRNQLEEAFTALGLSASEAASAANAARDAVTGATQSESFQLEMSKITAQETRAQQSDGDFYYGASLVAEQLEVSYDAESGAFTASVVRVSISIEIGTGDFVNDVGAGTLLNNSGGQIDLDQLLGGNFFNGLQLEAGEKDKALIAAQADNDGLSDVGNDPDQAKADEAGDAAEPKPLVLISGDQAANTESSSETLKSFRLDILLRVSEQAAPAQQLSVNQLLDTPAAPPAARPDPIDIVV
ncbi:hypothetical protein [Denitrobaculum tricleocarpae]|uniref:Uncharacterized protein n=1 Tax=Denitrobaculum tricleocarpae TaxID=2591009 RepID=A0A545TPT0_9PROT|nr:hypothetical protein [Denitrobaculum tricleocarpae]TQV79232.1 hypothetical protein FKG95_16375 [Denitrobaculum tricleocarpae]